MIFSHRCFDLSFFRVFVVKKVDEKGGARRIDGKPPHSNVAGTLRVPSAWLASRIESTTTAHGVCLLQTKKGRPGGWPFWLFLGLAQGLTQPASTASSRSRPQSGPAGSTR